MDSIYIQKVLKGDTGAFQYFVTTYKEYAYSISYSILRNNYLAEEAVQEAFIKVFENLRSYNGQSKFKTWLGRIVINESFRRSSKEKESVPINNVLETKVKDIENILETLLHKDQKYYISEALEHLRAEEALSLELFYLKEHSIDEICKLTDWSKPKTKMLLSRGRNNFYSVLKSLLKDDMGEVI